jgi:hypothetical protein
MSESPSSPASPATGPVTTRTAGYARCNAHPARFADWICTQCTKGWCPECAVVRKAPSTGRQLVQCPACRDRCELSPRRERADERSAREAQSRLSIAWAIGDALQRPLSSDGWVLFVASGILYTVAFVLGGPIGTLACLLPVPYFLRIVHHTARGRSGYPETGDISDWFWDLLAPALAFVLGCWLVAVPAGLYAIARPAGNIAEVATDPIFWLLVAVGFFYLPSVIITTAMTDSLGAALNPVVGLRLLSRVGPDYLILVGGALAIGFTWVFSGLPFLNGWLAPWVEVYVILATMALFGNVLYRHRTEIGLDPPA